MLIDVFSNSNDQISLTQHRICRQYERVLAMDIYRFRPGLTIPSEQFGFQRTKVKKSSF